MAAERAQNLQDTFLNHVRKNKTPLTIFLVNGVKLQCVVTWFDDVGLARPDLPLAAVLVGHVHRAGLNHADMAHLAAFGNTQLRAVV